MRVRAVESLIRRLRFPNQLEHLSVVAYSLRRSTSPLKTTDEAYPGGPQLENIGS